MVVVKMRHVALCLTMFIMTPNVAQAYLDPGTGSIILQALVAGVVSISVAFSSIRMKIKMFLRALFKTKDKVNDESNG